MDAIQLNFQQFARPGKILRMTDNSVFESGAL